MLTKTAFICSIYSKYNLILVQFKIIYLFLSCKLKFQNHYILVIS